MAFRDYAKYYDIFYKTKDYKKECAFLNQLFKIHAKHHPRTILDLGCGTGGHIVPLLQQGFQICGVDASESMLHIAKTKLKGLDLKAKLIKSRLDRFRFPQKFDAIICMFSVFDYLTTNQEIIKTLRRVSAHMKREALFIFDFWNEESVERHFSPCKKRSFRNGNMTIERHSSTTLDPRKRQAKVEYCCLIKEKGRPRETFRETHKLRYFTLDEVNKFLTIAGLRVVGWYPFLNVKGKTRSNTWDVTVVAQKDEGL